MLGLMGIKSVSRIEFLPEARSGWRLMDYHVEGETLGSEYVVRVAELRESGATGPQIVLWCNCPGFTNRRECSHQKELDQLFVAEDYERFNIEVDLLLDPLIEPPK
jgi:hypothetical protein